MPLRIPSRRPLSRATLTGSVLALALGACQKQAPEPQPGELPPGGEVYLTVNTQVVTRDMRDYTLKELPPQLLAQLEQNGQLAQVDEQLIISDLLYREALKGELHKTVDGRVALAMAQRNALADAQLKSVVEARTTDEAVQTWYQDHLVQFASPQVKARMMVVESEEAAAEVKTLLDGGADFAELARARSKDPATAAKGGEMDWVNKKDMPPQLATPLFDGAKGAVVGPIDMRGMLLIFLIEDRRDATPLEAVRDEVEGKLKEELMQAYIKELREPATVEMSAEASAAEASSHEGHGH